MSERMETMSDYGNDVETAPAHPARRSPWRHLVWILPLAAAAAAVAVWAVLAGGGTEEDERTTAALEFEEVVVADLTEVTEFDGTLGFDEGDPITAGLAGTLTAAAPEGAVVGEGEILFVVDDRPVPLLYGDTTVWRQMGLIPRIEQFVPRIAGTVTWLAPEGSTLDQGDVLMEVDDRPVVVLDGAIPAYRTMRRNVEGDDVLQLEEALVEMGYDPDGLMDVDGDFTSYTEDLVEEWQADVGAAEDGRVDLGEAVFVGGPFTIEEWLVDVGSQVGGSPAAAIYFETEATEGDDVLALEEALARLGFDAGGGLVADGAFDAATADAVAAWQASLGAEEDGIVDPGEVVFRIGAVRISDRLAEPGAAVGSGVAVLAASSDESVVTVDLPAADQAEMEEGDRVVIVLPDDSEVGGTVSFKAQTASIGAQGNATFEVVIVLDDPAAAEGLDQAPVDVEVVTDRADGVMAVPVTALLALAEGGYAVEVEQADGTTALVAVDPGMYAEGLVEVSSDGLRPGDRVVVP